MSIPVLVARLNPRNPPATPAEVEAVERRFGPLPQDYKEFLLLSNGYEGSVSGLYLALYRTSDVMGYNRDGTALVPERPDMIQIGGDGGGEGYFFDARNPGPVSMIALVSDWHTDARPAGASFTDFLANQLEGRSPLGGAS
ncbi:MAG: SMI1/KNR4 family protein [Phycisphaerales bacterium]